ncbi:MAG TPA: universal stress protein, partial [Actinopolymorphaceae bacterium]
MAEHRPRVIVGVDESQGSARALDFAAWEARSLSRPLHLVRGIELPVPSPFTGYVPYDEAARAAHTWVARAVDEARQRFPDLEISGSAVTGRGAAALLDRVTESDLLVVGSRSRSATRSILLGSVSSAVAAHAGCPVIVVRGEGGDGRRVVVGADGS